MSRPFISEDPELVHEVLCEMGLEDRADFLMNIKKGNHVFVRNDEGRLVRAMVGSGPIFQAKWYLDGMSREYGNGSTVEKDMVYFIFAERDFNSKMTLLSIVRYVPASKVFKEEN